MACPLCQNAKIQNLGLFSARSFIFCEECKLIFVPAPYRLGHEEEKNRYLLHHNKLEDKKYKAFLDQAINPALNFIGKKMIGLDYGCGPTPVLASLLGRQGITCQSYDPFFFPKIAAPAYDFIFSTECVEHFYHPKKAFDHLYRLLKNNGFLIIMTSFWGSLDGFPGWYYKNDPAHVAFYHFDTWLYLAEQYHYELVYCDQKKVVIFKK